MSVKLDCALVFPLRLSQITGLFPYNCNYDTINKSSWSIMTIFFTIIVTGNLYVALNSSNPLGLDAFIIIMFRILSVVPWMSTVALLMSSFTIQPGVNRVLKRLQMVGIRMNKSLQSSRITRIGVFLDFFIRTTVILCEIYAAYNLVRDKPIEQFIIRLIGFYLTHFIQNIYELQILSFVRLITESFRVLAKRLTTKNAPKMLDNYNDLFIAAIELNETFKFQNFATVSNCVLLCVVDCYILQTTATELTSPVGVNTSLRVVLRIYQVCVLVLTLDNMAKQARRSDEIIYALALADRTKRLISDVRIKEHFQQRATVIFTGWNVYSLDLTFLHSSAALMINYLIILLQFGGGKHSIDQHRR